MDATKLLFIIALLASCVYVEQLGERSTSNNPSAMQVLATMAKNLH